jgi:hypothetical protein
MLGLTKRFPKPVIVLITGTLKHMEAMFPYILGLIVYVSTISGFISLISFRYAKSSCSSVNGFIPCRLTFVTITLSFKAFSSAKHSSSGEDR